MVRAALFVGCINDVFFPRAAVAAVRVLERLGVRIEFPEAQTCCGQAHLNSGYPGEAGRLARHFLDVFEGVPYVVGLSGSCTAMVRESYLPLLRPLPRLAERAQRLAERLFEFSEFVVEVLERTDLGARYPAKAVYHASCHTTRLLHVVDAPLALLQRVDGLDLAPIAGAERCCGFGGTFSVKSPEVSVAMADDKLEAALAAGAEVVISGDTSCLLHLMGRARRRGLPLRFVHIAELLAQGMGLMRRRVPAGWPC